MLEIACFDINSAEIALQSDADRIEFCSSLEQGGLTPDINDFQYLKRNYLKPIYVMIRPVGGGFTYSESEINQMKNDVIQFRNAGADGFVFGILQNNNEVDINKNAELVLLAQGLPCTFHKAVDRTPDIFSSISQIIDLGFNSLLTSGGARTALEGVATLSQIIAQYGNVIEILVGGGVRSENILDLKTLTQAMHFHSSAIRKYEHYTSAEEIKLLKAGM